MDVQPVDQPDGERGRWTRLAAAAAALGLPSAEALRGRIRRSPTRYRTKRGNKGELLVWIERPDASADVRPAGEADARPPQPDATTAELVAELRARVEALERRLDEGHAERDRLLALLESALAEGRQRGPWPGLRVWLRKVWEGQG